MPSHAKKLLVLVLSAALITGFGVYEHIRSNKPSDVLATEIAVAVTARPVPLLESDPTQRTVGNATYVAGWALTADSVNFGGFSGLVVRPDGRLVAVSDRGDWFGAHFDPTAAMPLTAAKMRPFSDDAQGKSKAALDSESVITEGDGFLVSFEGQHRLVHVAADGTVMPSPYTALMDFTGVANNSGLEAITFADGKLLGFPERGVDELGRLRGWLVGHDASETIYFKPPRNYSPTDAATLKNGDVLILLRRYSLFDGVSAKLVRIPAAEIRAGATLVGGEVMHLEPPQTVDNMEGLDVIERPGQTPLVVMISDDNFRKSQRTLLLVFALESP
ncbi:esterase-like activity of phytase family protein [Kordiimonas aestuarii]|uniref:esterase-like activity of phytase family protein n=1 Tax=Kordiimonas aestuarii TaxID=1005925 RepID=UPI0021D391A9|nr:esterase-like activity of phytase family protein [Kordiimonas aestuarii]